MPVKRGRIGLKQKLRENAIQMRFLASASPRELSDDAQAATIVPTTPAPVKRAKKQERSPEGKVLDAIIDYLKTRNDIAMLTRHNSGVMQEGQRYVRMNTVYVKRGEHWLRVLDVECMKRGTGQTIRLEVKAPGWKSPKDDHEWAQWETILEVREAGGLAGFCQSVDDVRKILGES